MDARSTTNIIGAFLGSRVYAQPHSQSANAGQTRNNASSNQQPQPDTLSVPVSGTIPVSEKAIAPDGRGRTRTHLIGETLEHLEDGFRRTQQFVRPDGRIFVRDEALTNTPRGFTRIVVRDNPSGSSIRLEETVEQRGPERFSRTLRFTDESGETQTHIDDDFSPGSPFPFPPGSQAGLSDLPGRSEKGHARGIQLDLSV